MPKFMKRMADPPRGGGGGRGRGRGRRGGGAGNIINTYKSFSFFKMFCFFFVLFFSNHHDF